MSAVNAQEMFLKIEKKIPSNVKPIETNSRQRFRILRVNFWFM